MHVPMIRKLLLSHVLLNQWLLHMHLFSFFFHYSGHGGRVSDDGISLKDC